MVMLRNDQIEEFPWFHMFLEELVLVQDSPRIWEAFQEWSGLGESEALKVVSYGTFPIVNIKKSIFDNAHDYGHFSESKPNDIWVRRDSVQTYEKTTDPTVEWQTGKYLEMLILHELVHWGRFHSSLGDDFEENGLDSGKLFANAAYTNRHKPHLG